MDSTESLRFGAEAWQFVCLVSKGGGGLLNIWFELPACDVACTVLEEALERQIIPLLLLDEVAVQTHLTLE